jgi:hypothetical protein
VDSKNLGASSENNSSNRSSEDCHSLWNIYGRLRDRCTADVNAIRSSSALFVGINEYHGGFSEPTVFKQRFLLWSFLVANKLWYNVRTLAYQCKLGWVKISSLDLGHSRVIEPSIDRSAFGLDTDWPDYCPLSASRGC